MADGSFAELRAELKQRADGKALPLPHAGEPLYRSMSIRAIRKDKREVDFVCSTESLDSHGTVLEQDWAEDDRRGLRRFDSNPVILYNHNVSMRDLPIGQGRNVRVEGEGADRQLVATVWFSDKTQLAREAWDLVEEGTLRGISVGFDWSSLRFEERGDVEVIVLYGLELIELSITPTPSNGDCLARQLRARAGAPLTRPDASSKPLTTPTPKAAERSAQAPSARKDKTMTEEEIKALQARTAELATKNIDIEARAASFESRAVKAEKELAEIQLRTSTLDAQNVRLVTERDAANERAVKAEGEVIALEVGGLVGRKIEPHEKDMFVELRTTNKPLFDKMIAQRKEMALDKPVIAPAGNGTIPASEQRSAVASGDNSVAADEFFADV